MKFTRLKMGKRPTIELEVSRVESSTWPIFQPYHYMSADLVKSARCFGAFVANEIVAFVAVLWFPHPVKSACGYRIHRLVTLPDWQGAGIGMKLLSVVCSAFATENHIHMPAAHPSLIRTLDKSREFALVKKPGVLTSKNRRRRDVARMGGRPCAVFRFVGKPMDGEQARRLIA